MNLFFRRKPSSLAANHPLNLASSAAPLRHAPISPPVADSPPLDPSAESTGPLEISVSSARVPPRHGSPAAVRGPCHISLLVPGSPRATRSPCSSVRAFSSGPGKLPEYEMPSVTWGVIQGRKEKLVSRVIISDYLRSLGIVPDELEHLELPSTVEVMRERVEFLQKLGLTVDDMNEYPLMLGCSVRKNTIPVLGYLEKIGVQRSKMGEFVKNYPQILHASVVVELVPVVRFLRGLDVERLDVPYVLQRYPELLGFKLEGTMSTSVAYLVSIGVRPRDIGPMVTQYPYFLGMRVGTMIKPLVEYLISLGIPKMVLARILEKRPYVLGYDLEETVKPNVETLLSFGIRKEVLPSVVAQYPQILGLPLKAKLSSQQYFFTLKLKIDPDGFARVVEKMPQIASLNQSVILKPVEFLRGRAIPVEDVAKMVVKCPQLVALRVELMKNSYYFFKSEMKRSIQELVEFPEYFTYSLELRIKPRYHKLAQKGIKCSLGWFLNCSDQRFEERLQADYIETETVGPSFCVGGKLEMPICEIMSEEEEDESDDEVLYRRTVSL
uniref:Transcription termination factor MTERF4, chloroplastic n=1 Tax=Anthurium amnicola TaxID=1678845 RepID=A0A1D1ZKF9_9ARAE